MIGTEVQNRSRGSWIYSRW